MKMVWALLAAMLPISAWAHGGHLESSSFMQGLLHPLLGLDHLLALIAGGLWLSRLSSARILWALLAFSLLATLAIYTGSIFNNLAVEWGLIATVVLLLLFMVASKRWYSGLGYTLAGVAVTVHNLAHGAELQWQISTTAGVLLSSIFVLIGVVALAQAAKRSTLLKAA